jgi:hypothetical protein
MFHYEVEKDFFDKNQTHYWLTQGDSCAIISTPKDSEGNIISPSQISLVKFKIVEECSNKILFEKQMPLYSTNKYMFSFLPSESAELEIGRYNYEIEYTLSDGGVNTPNQWKFEIIPQGVTEV